MLTIAALSPDRRLSLAVVAASGLVLWHVWANDVVGRNVLALRVMRQVVPAAPTFDAPYYRAEVTWALGFAGQPESVRQDRTLMTALEAHSGRNRSLAILAASYAMLTRPVDPSVAARILAREAPGNWRLFALWRGRAAWARGSKSEARGYWQAAYGDAARHRLRLAEGLEIASRTPDDVLVAADAAVSVMYLSDCDDSCRTEVVEMLRYWIVWPSSQPGETVGRLCDHILGAIKPGAHDRVVNAGVANVLARRALALHEVGRVADAEASLDRAEASERTVYVRSVRAYFLVRSDRRSLAREQALAVVRDAGTDGHALMMAAQALEESGARAEARRAWTLTIQRAPRLTYAAQAFLDAHPPRD